MAYTSVALLLDECFQFSSSKPTDYLSIYSRQATSCVSQSFRFLSSFQKYLALNCHHFLFMLESCTVYDYIFVVLLFGC